MKNKADKRELIPNSNRNTFIEQCEKIVYVIWNARNELETSFTLTEYHHGTVSTLKRYINIYT